MDDRFHNENLGVTGKYKGVNDKESKPALGDFSEIIDSNATAEPVVAPKAKKFEVHIPDIDSETAIAAPAYEKQEVSPEPSAEYSPLQEIKPTQSEDRVVAPKKSKANSKNKKTAPVDPKLKAKMKQKKARIRASRRYEFIKNLLLTCVCFIFIATITVSISTVAVGFLNDILVLSDDNDFTADVEIPEGATYDQVFDILCEAGLVRQPYLTDIFLRFRHYDKVQVKNPETGLLEDKFIEYEPGIYRLNYSDGIENMIETIMYKTNYAKDTVRLTFPEGWSIAQIFAKIEKYGVCEADKLYANLDIVGNQYGFISEIDAEGGRYLTCEGYLFPDTYDFFIGEAPSSVLKKLFNNYEAKWSDDYTERLEELGITMDEAIIIASIIQREAKDGSQMKDISSVIHNRLNDPVNFPNIQMNSTTDYITSIKQFDLFSDSYYAMYLDQYNTYKGMGLPPGPICNPGKTAINAALYPSDTNYYFFCHDKSGEVYYAATAQEHADNTSKVLYG